MTLATNNNRAQIPHDVQAKAAAYISGNWSRRIAQPVLIALFVTAQMSGVLVVVRQLLPQSPWLILSPIIFIISLLSVYTTIWLSLPQQRPLNKFAYRGAEFVLILLIMRLLTWVVADSWPQPEQFATYLRHPLTFFGGTLFIFGIIFVFIGWQLANYLGNIFGRLAIDMAEAVYYLLPPKERNPDSKPVIIFRHAITRQLFSQWVTGGIVLSLMATLSTVDLTTFSSKSPLSVARLGLEPAMLLALIGYFLVGLLLLSQARLAAMKARWLMGGTEPQPQVDHIWQKNAVWVLVALAAAASFLPIGSTFAISRILQAVIYGVTAFFGILAVLFVSLLTILFNRVVDMPVTPEATAVPLPPATPPALSPAPPPNETFGIIGSSAFWTIAIVVSFLAITFILRERGVRFQLAQVQTTWTWLKTQLRQLWRKTKRQARQWQQTVVQWQTEREIAQKGKRKRPFRFLRVNALSPREQIHFFYLATLRQAAQQGKTRRLSDTPLEFAQKIKETWPEADKEVDILTNAFIRARYTPEEITPADASPIKSAWQTIRRKLRRNP
ncbi:MAG: hypothetical protein Kow0080_09740 [Candidatus Promineifilaceae bacterium]